MMQTVVNMFQGLDFFFQFPFCLLQKEYSVCFIAKLLKKKVFFIKIIFRVAIIITDGESAWPEETVIEAKKAREAGINVIAVGVNNAVYEELVAIAGDQSQVFHVDSFDELDELVDGITTATCTCKLKRKDIFPVVTVVNFLFF